MKRWHQMGAVAADDDRRAGNGGPISDDELRGVLALHFCHDLDALDDGDRSEAIDALVEGYRGEKT